MTANIAKARRTPRGSSLDQIRSVLAATPAETVVQRRDRAIIALIALTAPRVNAVVSLKMRNIDIDRRVLPSVNGARSGTKDAPLASGASFPFPRRNFGRATVGRGSERAA